MRNSRINKDFQTERGGNLDLKIRQNKGKIKVNGKGKGNTLGKMQRRQKGTQKGKRQIKVQPKAKKRYIRIIGSTYKGLIIGKKKVSLKAEKR